MRFDGFRNVDVGDDFAVDDDERIVFEQLPRIVERARSAEYFGYFFRVMNIHAVIVAVAEDLADGFGLMMEIDDNILKAEFGDVFGNVTDERFAEKRNRR